MKKTSTGVIITDGRYTLLGHATGKPLRKGYDIFKGGKESGEKWVDAALRELKEEAGVILEPQDLIDMGKYDYRPNKNLRIFVYRSNNVKKEFPMEDLSCSSYLEDGTLEMDMYKYIPIHRLHLYLYPSLYPIVFKIIQDLPKGISWEE